MSAMKRMVDRFLSWELPFSAKPDICITAVQSGRYGTNILDANETEQMLLAVVVPELHVNGLTPAEAERLAALAEECGELIQVIGKIQRHGYCPTDLSVRPPVSYNNREDLEKEVGDVILACQFLESSRDVSGAQVMRSLSAKLERKCALLHHQPPELIRKVTAHMLGL